MIKNENIFFCSLKYIQHSKEWEYNNLGAVPISRCHLTSTEIPAIKITQSHDYLTFIMEIPTPAKMVLTHWGRVTHICVSNLTIIGSDNGLSPGRHQAIIWNNAGILSIGLLGTNFSEILIEILTFSFKKMRLKVSSAKWRPFCLSLNVLMLKWAPESMQYAGLILVLILCNILSQA